MKRVLLLFAVMLTTPLPIVAQAKDVGPDAAAKKKQVEEDRKRLYQLAAELKAEVGKSGKNTLSSTAIQKAAEIEKLARQRLYQLSTELKAEVEKSDKNTLPSTAIQKAAEIENLAKILKETVK